MWLAGTLNEVPGLRPRVDRRLADYYCCSAVPPSFACTDVAMQGLCLRVDQRLAGFIVAVQGVDGQSAAYS